MEEIKILKNIEKVLSAILAMLAENRENSKLPQTAIKTEAMLSKLGFSALEISKIINKNPAAVIKTIQRSKGK